MRGTSTMCEPDTAHHNAPDPYVYDPLTLTTAQREGNACAVCHAQWPRPRRILGVLPDGGSVHGCSECAGLIGLAPHTSVERHLAAAH